mgnify:CR=1 FL=1
MTKWIFFLLFLWIFPKCCLTQEPILAELDETKLYRIQSCASSMYLNCAQTYSGSPITQTIFSSEEKSGQLWRFILVNNGCYRIQSQYSGLYLTCSNIGDVAQEKYSVGALARQLWRVIIDREGHHLIQSVQTGLYLSYFRRREAVTDTTKERIRCTSLIQPEGATRKYSPESQKREERKSIQYWKILQS